MFEAFGEASEGVHELVQFLANIILKAKGLQQGRERVKWVLVGKSGDFSVLHMSGLRQQAG